MLNNLVEKKEWLSLKVHHDDISQKKISSFFDENLNRFENLSQSFESVFFDYSKQHINEETVSKLCDLAKACGVEERRQNLFSGEKINITEDRAVLHTALRDLDTKAEISETLSKIEQISYQIHEKKKLGKTGKPIKKIVSLGIGGSDLGPRLVCDALKTPKSFPVHFVSNIDDDDLNDALVSCDPETTLFIVISKSFGTQETYDNYRRAKEWIGDESSTTTAKHFIAITTNKQAALNQGFSEENILPIWEWINGRFSVCSAVGLPIAIALGFENFQKFLEGAHKIDTHFRQTPLEKNIPILMALIGIWNINFLGYKTHALLPYAKRLKHFPSYIQQLDMESNGKSVDLNGNLISQYTSGPIVFGDVGTNGQHNFYQHLHQGTQKTPCDFIGFKNKNKKLLNNMLAQSQALMTGQEHENPHQYFKGNTPSSTLLFDNLDAYTLGMLIALYEHKIFVQGIIWNINSFDQFGVELGKKIAKALDQGDLTNTDASTKGLYYLINRT